MLLKALAFLLFFPAIAYAQPPSPAADCRAAVVAAERAVRLPPRLLTTISLVESGRPDPATGRFAAWPWTINADGNSFFYDTKEEAILAARAMHAAGVVSMDVGCMQISLLFHPFAFATLEQAFDPKANAAYGARFLAALYGQTGDWLAAAAAYHSQTPELGAAYQQRIMAIWPQADQLGRAPGPRAAGSHTAAGAIQADSQYAPAMRAMLERQQADQKKLAGLAAGVTAPALRAMLTQQRADQARLLGIALPRGATAPAARAAVVPVRNPAMVAQAQAAPVWRGSGGSLLAEARR
jgi:hypothetical protein